MLPLYTRQEMLLSTSNKKILDKIRWEISIYHNWYGLALIFLYECRCYHQHVCITGDMIVFTFFTEHIVMVQLFIIHGRKYCYLRHSIVVHLLCWIDIVLTRFWHHLLPVAARPANPHSHLMHSTKYYLTVYVFREFRPNAHRLNYIDGSRWVKVCAMKMKPFAMNSTISIYYNHYDEIADIPNSLLHFQIKTFFLCQRLSCY